MGDDAQVGLVREQAVDDIGELTGRRNGAGSKASVAPPLCVWACRRCTAAGLVCRKPSAIARCRGNNRLVYDATVFVSGISAVRPVLCGAVLPGRLLEAGETSRHVAVGTPFRAPGMRAAVPFGDGHARRYRSERDAVGGRAVAAEARALGFGKRPRVMVDAPCLWVGGGSEKAGMTADWALAMISA